MSESRICSECGSPLPRSSSHGICPKCCLALAVGLDDETAAGDRSAWPPGPGAGQNLGSYKLVELIGEGGMGVVYKARQTKLNRIVAVKMLRSGSLASKEELRRFRIEAQAAARLQHPNIVAVHEVGQHEGHVFFSMDYIQGRSLSQILGRTPLPPARAARYTREIAQAIHYAHTQGVLHRDLKPGNVLIDEKDQPRITDFGLAKATDSDDGSLSAGVLGTPSYMSPEQASGRHDSIGPATDIYSLGAILYDLLTGRPPFRADTPAETMRHVIEREPAPLRLLNPKVDRDLETICLKCLSKEPKRRYGTAAELADDLGRLLSCEPIRARRIGGLGRAYRWVRRHPSLAALAANFALMVVLLGWFSYWDAVDSASGAWGQAARIELLLNQIGQRVEGIARHPQLAGMIKIQPPRARYAKFLADQIEANRTQLRGGAVNLANLLLMTPGGEVLENYALTGGSRDLPNLGSRDYFRGATNLPGGFYISRSFKSLNDGKQKIGVSSPVFGEDGRLAGVLAALILTGAAPYPGELQVSARTRMVLVAELDPLDIDAGRAETEKHVIFWHPGYKRGREQLVPVSDPRIPALLSAEKDDSPLLRNSWYTDPIDGGRWVAGFSKVSGTHLVVVCQVRNRVGQVLLVGTGVAVALVLGGVASMLRRRRGFLQKE